MPIEPSPISLYEAIRALPLPTVLDCGNAFVCPGRIRLGHGWLLSGLYALFLFLALLFALLLLPLLLFAFLLLLALLLLALLLLTLLLLALLLLSVLLFTPLLFFPALLFSVLLFTPLLFFPALLFSELLFAALLFNALLFATFPRGSFPFQTGAFGLVLRSAFSFESAFAFGFVALAFMVKLSAVAFVVGIIVTVIRLHYRAAVNT